MASSSSGVTVHLDRSRTARPFRLDESLWDQEFAKIDRILGDHLKMVERSNSPQRPPNLALAIYGGYGSGKTSLLSTLVELVNDVSEESGSASDPFKDTRSRLFSLPILRPNLLAEGQSFLYAFLAAVLRQAEGLTGRAGQAGERSKDAGLMTQTERALQGVIEYLQVLDESETASEHDPIGASVARLERHASDHHLKNALDDLIYLLADRLPGARGLILVPIDDIDLDQQKLFQTLDSLRRYLDHPRLVPICSFNGRLAEELLTSHFAGELRRKGDQTGELRGSQEFASEIALQYLSRMFPVRNRIRLAATTVKVQGARYTHGPDSDGEDGARAEEQGGGRGSASGKTIHQLLEEGSRVFFGHPEPLVEPRSKLAMRPMVLRRQIQVVDALQYAGVEDLATGDRSWFEVYKDAIWAVLDAHRDVLRELGIHLEDIYGWPSKTLREWLLTKIADRKGEQRDLLLDRWVYRTENRAGQVLSLLAANVFRPPVGSDAEYRAEAPLDLGGGGNRPAGGERRDADDREAGDGRLDASWAFTWFTDLWLGFYLPLILSRERSRVPDALPLRAMPTVGWHLIDAPALAMREVMECRTNFAPGMMLLRADSLRTAIRELKIKESKREATEEGTSGHTEKSGSDDSTETEGSENGGGNTGEQRANSDVRVKGRLFLVVNLWCFHGYSNGQPWMAISLWRVLSLIGQLLRLRGTVSKGTSPAEGESKKEEGATEAVNNSDSSTEEGHGDQAVSGGGEQGGEKTPPDPDPELKPILYLLQRHLELAHQPTSLEAQRTDRQGDDHGTAAPPRAGLSINLDDATQSVEIDLGPERDRKKGVVEGVPAADKSLGFAPFPVYDFSRAKLGELQGKKETGGNNPPGDERSAPFGFSKEDVVEAETLLLDLAGEVKEWLAGVAEKERIGEIGELTLDPLNPVPRGGDQEPAGDPPDGPSVRSSVKSWDACFLRRVHGDVVLSRWWTQLQNVYTRPELLIKVDDKKERFTGKLIVEEWKKAWQSYWGETSGLNRILDGCPLLEMREEWFDVLGHLSAAREFPVSRPELSDRQEGARKEGQDPDSPGDGETKPDKNGNADNGGNA